MHVEGVFTDGDGTGNNADTDDDNDGLSDVIEAGLGTDPLDPDTDDDGETNGFDNCRTDANANQDGDSPGDVCDDDRDSDGIANESDAFPDDASENADSDGDGIGDNADPCFNSTTQTGTTICGLNSEGVLTQTCTSGGWVDDGAEQMGTKICGLADEGFLFQACAGGAWVNGDECSSNDADGDGFTDAEEIAAGTDPLRLDL
jgi:hypothetical protein